MGFGGLSERRCIPVVRATPVWSSSTNAAGSCREEGAGGWQGHKPERSSESLPRPSPFQSGRRVLRHPSLGTGAAGRDPASWMGREEDTWPWGREQGQERNTPSLLAADGGTEIASAPFPRERARSMDIDRKTLPWSERPSALAGGRCGHSPASSQQRRFSQRLPTISGLPSIAPSPPHNPFPLCGAGVRLKGRQKDLRLWQRKERFLQRAKPALLLLQAAGL